MSQTYPRFQVRVPNEDPSARVVMDTWLGAEAYRTYVDRATPGQAQLLCETRASELNLTTVDPLGFVEKLRLHVDKARGESYSAGEVLEDLERILEHYVGQVRGTKTEPLDQTDLHVQATWVNRHGYGA